MAQKQNTTPQTELEAKQAEMDPIFNEPLVDFYRPLDYDHPEQNDMILMINGRKIGYKKGNHVKMPESFVKLVEQGETAKAEAAANRAKLASQDYGEF